MYKLLYDENQRVVGYTFIKEKEEGDVVFLAQDLPVVDAYLKPLHLEERQEMQEIQEWLKENDYKINKHTLGEYTDYDERWILYLQERSIKLARYNELEQLIKKTAKAPFDISALTTAI